jgi:hypothetical protein
MKKNKKIWLVVGLLVIVIVFVILNIPSIKKPFGQTETGKISLEVPLEGSEVYLDGKGYQSTSAKNQTLDIPDVAANTPHTVLVAKNGYWPWGKTVTVEAGRTLDLTAFNGPQAEVTTDVAAGSKDYAAATAALAANTGTPSKATMIVSKDGSVGIWVEGNALMAEWKGEDDPDQFFCVEGLCDKDTQVFKGTAPITHLAFYKNRDDIVLFSSGGAIYAIEINRNGTQNFQPVFMGANPTFAPSSDGTVLFVKDGGKIQEVLL